jgi:uncharacterized membrane protein
MFNYRQRVERDLVRWQGQGWITPLHGEAIRQDLLQRPSRVDLAGTLAILGAVLIGLGVMSFVAANWPHLSKLAKLSIIAVGLIASYGVAAALFARRLDPLAHAAVLLGTAVFGGGIMLISQMYHLDGHAPDAVWLWGIGALIAGLLIPSNPALASAMVLFGLWSSWELATPGGPQIHWAFLPFWAATAMGFVSTRWPPGFHLAALALSVWIVALGYQLTGFGKDGGHWVVLVIGITIIADSILTPKFAPAYPVLDRLARPLLGYGVAIAFAAMLALQFVAHPSTVMLIVLAAATLVALVAAIGWAWKQDNRPALWIAYTAFSIEIFALYIKKLGSLMDTSAFFLTAGLLVSGLAYAALRLHRASSSLPSQPGEPLP